MPYVATICVLLDVESDTEAMDAIGEAMRPLMQTHSPASCIRDWQWAIGEDELFKTAPIPLDFQPDNEWPDFI